MTFYNDVGTDIINYERATTDTISVTNADEYEQCIKLLASPEWYKKYNYKHFWTNYICVNFFGLVTILVLSVVFASGIDDLTDNSSEGLW